MPAITIFEPRRRQPIPPGGILRRSFNVGAYSVTMTHDLDAMRPGARSQVNVQWSPVPSLLTADEIRLYQRRRNRVYQEFADITGGKIMMVDL